jgi:hypothetical protein
MRKRATEKTDMNFTQRRNARKATAVMTSESHPYIGERLLDHGNLRLAFLLVQPRPIALRFGLLQLRLGKSTLAVALGLVRRVGVKKVEDRQAARKEPSNSNSRLPARRSRKIGRQTKHRGQYQSATDRIVADAASQGGSRLRRLSIIWLRQER